MLAVLRLSNFLSLQPLDANLSLIRSLESDWRKLCPSGRGNSALIFDLEVIASLFKLAPSQYAKCRTWEGCQWPTESNSALNRYFKMETAPEGAAVKFDRN